MMNLLKRLAARLPSSCQHEMKCIYYASQIRRQRFRTEEREYDLLTSFLTPGDWVVDVGANVGHYTLRLSAIVGRTGRVFALEPVPNTFALLASNVVHSGAGNVTLLNVAASDSTSVVGMDVPRFDTGLSNYYQARITETSSELRVLCMPLDSLELASRVTLVKIDTEGHELRVLHGMTAMLQRDRPTLIVETEERTVRGFLDGMGYVGRHESGSPNWVFTYRGAS